MRIREAVVPKRNTLSHANRHRDATMAEELFWTMLDHLQKMTPRFGDRTLKGMPRRFKRFYCLLRSNLWSKYDLDSLAETCGTAGGTSKDPPSSAQRFLPGFEAYFSPELQ